MVREAKCCCGKLRIRTKGEPVINAVCHCDNCKQRTGSAFGMSVYFENSQIIEIIGKSNIYHIDGENKQNRHFCQNCGTTVYWNVASTPGKTGVAGGCFSSKTLTEPKFTVSNENQCAWLSLPKHWKHEITREDIEKHGCNKIRI